MLLLPACLPGDKRQTFFLHFFCTSSSSSSILSPSASPLIYLANSS